MIILQKKPSFIVDEDPENLVKRFVEDLRERQRKIAEKVDSMYPLPGGDEKSDDEESGGERAHLPKKVRNLWKLGLIKFLFLVLILEGTTLT